jgi:DNA helicase-2/ATP-dependent DNA helicase PcrA
MIDFDGPFAFRASSPWEAGPFGPSASAEPSAGPGPTDESAARRILEALNEPQARAVQITDGPLIVLAGAGSGKTKMLTSRIAYLTSARGVPPTRILAVTFTNKAAQEMRERVARLIQDTSALGEPEIGTFHSVCVRILRRELAHTPFTRPFVIYDDSDQLALIKSVLKKLEIDEKVASPKSLQALINRAKCDAIEPEPPQPGAPLAERRFQLVYARYQAELFANNAIDFGEILCLTYRLLRDSPEMRRRYQTRFRYIHVDEYQDTNRAQYLLLSLLASPAFGGHGNICVVGDEDQSIYKWRGADIRNILDFEREYPGAQVVKLEQNYRSTATIIEAAGHLIRNNTERKDKTLWTDNARGEPIRRMLLADERAEAEAIVSEIQRMRSQEGRSLSDFAIFYRTHAQSRSFEDVLRREKIPYRIVGGLRFYDRKEIKDILCYFRVLLNPNDSVSLKRIINSPARGIGKTTLDKLEALQVRLEAEGPPASALEAAGSEGLDASYWSAIRLAASDPALTSASTARKLASFVTLIRGLMEFGSGHLLSELYHRLLDDTGYVRDLRIENTEESLARIDNLGELDNLLKEFEADFGDALASRQAELLPLFLEQSTLASDVESGGASGEGGAGQVASVQMMTLHSSKGLEFPVVFLPGLEEGLFPSVRPWEKGANAELELEEERRLCYVGMTRARELLYLSGVEERRIWGEIQYQEPSRFFEEIPADAVQFRDLTQVRGWGSSRSGGFVGGATGGATGGLRRGGAPRLGASREYGRSAAHGSGRGFESDGYESRSLADEVPQVAPASRLEGCAVAHPDYGTGRIVLIEGPEERDDTRVTVLFSRGERRKFLLRFVRAWVESE